MSTAVGLTPDWKQWEGDTVDGQFPLDQFVGSSSVVTLGAHRKSAVFRTRFESAEAAIKLIPARQTDARNLVQQWSLAAGLDHPHLLKIFKTGLWTKAGTTFAYVVTEFGDENLGDVLAERPLDSEEVREMLPPVAGVLEFLHGRDLTLGNLCPSNIFAVNETLKLSRDAVAQGEAASDLRAFAAAITEALTQKRVTLATRGEMAALDSLAEPFRTIAVNCAGRNGVMWSAAQLVRHLQSQSLDPSRDKSKIAAGSAADASPSGRTRIKLKPTTYTLAFALVLVATVTVGIVLRNKQVAPSQAPPQTAAQSAAPAVETTQAAPAESPRLSKKAARAAKAAAAAKAKADARAEAEAKKEAAAKAQIAKNDAAKNAAAKDARSQNPAPARVGQPKPQPAATGPVSAEVTQQVLPEITTKARETVHGKVAITVDVAVDPAGAVTSATLEPTNSHYFGKLATEAARKWRFAPGSARRLRLRFDITRTDTNVIVQK